MVVYFYYLFIHLSVAYSDVAPTGELTSKVPEASDELTWGTGYFNCGVVSCLVSLGVDIAFAPNSNNFPIY